MSVVIPMVDGKGVQKTRAMTYGQRSQHRGLTERGGKWNLQHAVMTCAVHACCTFKHTAPGKDLQRMPLRLSAGSRLSSSPGGCDVLQDADQFGSIDP